MRTVLVFAVFCLTIESARVCWSGNSYTDSWSGTRKSQTCSCGKGCAKYYNVDQQQWYWGCSCFYDYNQQKDVEYCPSGNPIRDQMYCCEKNLCNSTRQTLSFLPFLATISISLFVWKIAL